MRAYPFINPQNSHIRAGLGIIMLFLAANLIITFATAQAATWYVKTNGSDSNSGTSWGSGFQTIQRAIDAASDEDEIWVKMGTYRPEESIRVNKNVDILGGFDGSETQHYQRDWETNLTTVDGNQFNVNEYPRAFDVYHHARIDGFTISHRNGGIYCASYTEPRISRCTFYHLQAEKGSAIYNHYGSGPYIDQCKFFGNGTDLGGAIYNDNTAHIYIGHSLFRGNLTISGKGAAIYNDFSFPHFDNCTFENNSAVYGGAVYNYVPIHTPGEVVSFFGCTFSENEAFVGGGAIYNDAEDPTMVCWNYHCTFSNNTASQKGGAIYNYKARPYVEICTFSANEAGWGGGIYNDDNASPYLYGSDFLYNIAQDGGGGIANYKHSSPTLTNCDFIGNIAYTYGGGGIANNNHSSPTLTGCLFLANKAESSNGGGFYSTWTCSPILTDCSFRENSANNGGGIHNHSLVGTPAPTIRNCVFLKNVADNHGGGIYNSEQSTTVTNCTFSGNDALRGGGIFNASASPTVTNTILWQNFAEEGSQIHNHQSNPTVTFSNIQGGYPGGGNINVNPLFEHVDVSDSHTDEWDVHLQSGSPCIDTGSNAAPAIPQTDYDGDSRIMDGDNDGTDTADIGCDEYRPSNIPPPNWCEGDFGGDGDVDEADLAAFAADFGRTDCDLEDTCNGDFDDDSDADGSELATFATDLGRTDCP